MVGVALHVANGAVFVVAFEKLGLGGVRAGVVAAEVENTLAWPAMAIVDSKGLRERTRRMDVHLDVVHTDDASLVADLERRLGGTVLHHEVNDVDYVRQTMLVDVRYRAGTKGRYVRELTALLGRELPYCRVRYAF